MTAALFGYLDWGVERDEEGHRKYSLKSLVQCTSVNDGPAIVMNAVGLPAIGAPWSLGNDFDGWATCDPGLTVSRKGEYRNEPGIWWEVDQTFSTRPLERCQDTSIDDPLLEPPRVSGSFARFQKEISKDRNGNLIIASNQEPITGIMKDASRPTVVVEQNVAILGLGTFSSMVDTVNDGNLWGLTSRKIKLSNVAWSRKLFGTCDFYYTRKLDFEVRFEGFDETEILDAGYKVLRGKWSTGDPPVWTTDGSAVQTNKDHYILAKDPNDENEVKKVLLDGSGRRLTGTSTPVFRPTVEKYDESDFLLLGVPTII